MSEPIRFAQGKLKLRPARMSPPSVNRPHLAGRWHPRAGPSSAKAASLGMPILVESAQVQSSVRDLEGVVPPLRGLALHPKGVPRLPPWATVVSSLRDFSIFVPVSRHSALLRAGLTTNAPPALATRKRSLQGLKPSHFLRVLWDLKVPPPKNRGASAFWRTFFLDGLEFQFVLRGLCRSPFGSLRAN